MGEEPFHPREKNTRKDMTWKDMVRIMDGTVAVCSGRVQVAAASEAIELTGLASLGWQLRKVSRADFSFSGVALVAVCLTQFGVPS